MSASRAWPLSLALCTFLTWLVLLMVAAPSGAATVEHHEQTIAGVPVQVVRVDLRDPSILLDMVLANDAPKANSQEKSYGDEPFEAMVRRTRPAALINGTFFSQDGDKRVLGNMTRAGEVVKYSEWETGFTTFYLRAGNRPGMVTSDSSDYQKLSSAWLALTAGPRLLWNGQVWLHAEREGFNDSRVYDQRVRSALGYDAQGKTLFLVGFRSEISLAKEAEVMRELGCYQAMNLDGGASRALAVDGKVVIRPGRRLTNTLAVYDSAHPPTKAIYGRWSAYCALPHDTDNLAEAPEPVPSLDPEVSVAALTQVLKPGAQLRVNGLTFTRRDHEPRVGLSNGTLLLAEHSFGTIAAPLPRPVTRQRLEFEACLLNEYWSVGIESPGRLNESQKLVLEWRERSPQGLFLRSDGVVIAQSHDPEPDRRWHRFGVAVADGQLSVYLDGDPLPILQAPFTGPWATLSLAGRGEFRGLNLVDVPSDAPISLPARAAQFKSPRGLAVDAQGNRYVADSGESAVFRLDRAGRLSRVACFCRDGATGSPNFAPTALGVDRVGNLFVADANDGVIYWRDPQGRLATVVPAASLGALAVGNGALWFKPSYEGRLLGWRYSAPGQPLEMARAEPGAVEASGTEAESLLARAEHMALEASGSWVLSDTAGDRIVRVSPDGHAQVLAGGHHGFADGPPGTARFRGPMGVAVAPDGSVLVADSGNHRIRRIAPDGTVSTLAGSGSGGFADGPAERAKFLKPGELAMEPSGALLVLDEDNHVIRRIAPDGEVSTLTADEEVAELSAMAVPAGGVPVLEPSGGRSYLTFCGRCGRPIHEAFHRKNGQGFHDACLLKSYSLMCPVCHQPVLSGHDQDGERYHAACYAQAFNLVCPVCHEPALTGTDRDGHRYHLTCYYQAYDLVCPACGKQIDGPYRMLKDHHYHPECYLRAAPPDAQVAWRPAASIPNWEVGEGTAWHPDGEQTLDQAVWLRYTFYRFGVYQQAWEFGVWDNQIPLVAASQGSSQFAYRLGLSVALAGFVGELRLASEFEVLAARGGSEPAKGGTGMVLPVTLRIPGPEAALQLELGVTPHLEAKKENYPGAWPGECRLGLRLNPRSWLHLNLFLSRLVRDPSELSGDLSDGAQLGGGLEIGF